MATTVTKRAVAHRRDRESAGRLNGPDDPANFTLMMLVSMSEPGLQIMPTHRLVTGVGDLNADDLPGLLGEHFELETIGKGTEALTAGWESIQTGDRQDLLGFGTVADGAWTLARLRRPESMSDLVADHSETWRSLGVAILHRLALDHCLAKAGQRTCRYVHLTGEVDEAMRQRNCQLACLVQSATVDHIRQLSATFEKMPPKSTYFYPKLASGLVFNPIH